MTNDLTIVKEREIKSEARVKLTETTTDWNGVTIETKS